ncbi:MAG: DUF2970 domain-containing protein [Burkholderiaceae bacterium]|nr:DUF2970 domain-containing protein [Burkholderiaceae bacterium]
MNLLQMIRMVLWSFFGIRKRAGLESDIKSAHPLQILAVALALVAVFIGILLTVVKTAIHILM